MASGLLQKFDAGRIYDLAIYDLPFAIYVGYVRRSIGIKKCGHLSARTSFSVIKKDYSAISTM